MDDQELICRIAIADVEGIGPVTLRKLISLAGSARGLLDPGPEIYMKATEPQRNWLREINAIEPKRFKWAQTMVNELKRTSFDTLTFEDPRFPFRLRHCHDAPPWIFVKGKLSPVKHVVSIVGSRQASEYGRRFVRDLVKHLSAFDVAIVSGLAVGIDVEAHRAAIKYALPTWAVLAHGFDKMYPFSNRHVARDILDQGAWITEFLPRTRPEKENFPKRNRIIAGLCDVCVVVEAARKGGALITAKLSNEYGRDVMALPGRVTDEFSAGCNSLIRNHQAHLIEHPNNLTELLGWKRIHDQPQLQLPIELSEFQHSILKLIGSEESCSIESLCKQLNCELPKALPVLLQLEMEGLIVNTGAHHYIRAG
ncbi:MAG: DNA-processing protein DprA [Flavobacteriales bacterium]|nr:DNA-processing protein DprA [Flavobacteriales bacterium]